MITKAAKYEYPITGAYNETTATLDDGRVVTVNTQYGVVLSHGSHKADCDQLTKMGGRCTCGLLDGIDVAALVADARANGKRGPKPMPKPTAGEIERSAREIAELEAQRRRNGLCLRCNTYCHGDCGQ
ncbi:MAG: hypothetical protein HUU17_12880 [Chthonomonadales bacterium]|nr:hypothetical protein [Chthonomonadales bacterium]